MKHAYIKWGMLPDVLNTKDLMAIFQISEPTCLRFMREGVIPAKKIGVKWYASKAAIQAFIESTEDK